MPSSLKAHHQTPTSYIHPSATLLHRFHLHTLFTRPPRHPQWLALCPQLRAHLPTHVRSLEIHLHDVTQLYSLNWPPSIPVPSDLFKHAAFSLAGLHALAPRLEALHLKFKAVRVFVRLVLAVATVLNNRPDLLAVANVRVGLGEGKRLVLGRKVVVDYKRVMDAVTKLGEGSAHKCSLWVAWALERRDVGEGIEWFEDSVRSFLEQAVQGGLRSFVLDFDVEKGEGEVDFESYLV